MPGVTCTRDAFNQKKVSDAGEEEHDGSGVFTGATYNILLAIYSALKGEAEMEEALHKAGQIRGVFMMRAMDFLPENDVTLDDLGKAYLKAFLSGPRPHMLVNEFLRWKLSRTGTESDWLAHKATLPQQRGGGRTT